MKIHECFRIQWLLLLPIFWSECPFARGDNLRGGGEATPLAGAEGLQEHEQPSNALVSYDTILSTLPESSDPVDHYPYSMLREYGHQPLEASDTAFFWHVPKSAGSNLKRLFGACLNLTIASEFGKILCRKQQQIWEPTDFKQLRVCSNKLGGFVNVDTSYGPGIGRAKSLGLVPSRLADVVVSIDFRSASALFTPDFRGRAFVVFRHPVERIVSTFYYLAQADWEQHFNPDFAHMSVAEYARSPACPHDWLTRGLLGLNGLDYHRPLTLDDARTAKSLVRRKILVLLMDDFEASLRRLTTYFGWVTDEESSSNAKECMSDSVGKKENGVAHESVEEGSEAWNLIVERNRFDMELYEYARTVYEEQGKTLFPNMDSSSPDS